MKLSRILLLFVLPVYLCSCHTQQKLPNYLENLVDTSGRATVITPELRIQKGDLLSIQIFSQAIPTPQQPNPDDIWNPFKSSTAAGGAQASSTTGFLVDVHGNIEHPRITPGVFHVEGLTKEELAVEIKRRLTQPVELLKDPTVIIRILNFQVSVVGDVNKTGMVPVPGENITILQAIALAGDFNQYGRKNTVKVLRTTNGERKIGIIDLSSKDLFDSPYYNLEQNDVVFVEPSKQKAKQTDQNIVSQKIGLSLSVITAAAFIYNIFK